MMSKNVKFRAIMDDNAVRKSACGQEMGNYGFSWSVLKVIFVA